MKMTEGKICLIAAGIVLNEQKNKILLIKRADLMWGDVWSIPGGHIEYGETVDEALKRELKEELNLEISDTKFLCYEEFSVPTKRNKYFISLNFIVLAKERIVPNEEIKEAGWFDVSKLSEINHKVPKEGIEYIDGL